MAYLTDNEAARTHSEGFLHEASEGNLAGTFKIRLPALHGDDVRQPAGAAVRDRVHPARGTPEETLRDFAAGLAAGARVRGAIIGRNLLFPGEADPLPLARALSALVHRKASLPDALKRLREQARPRRRGAAAAQA